MAQTKVNATKEAETGGASPTEVPQRISNAEMTQVDHFAGWRAVKLRHLD